ncbi:hypothetical protein ElyMa_006606200 [Elysia marginata]|uniref:SMB domain-containing protein n=1 Tax=Elysia marginata TaxID=1093978 RepID=A0AAV4IE19_9GAST|nr:hypothetical protein ElyMa_006606200 [Elysia marginata]
MDVSHSLVYLFWALIAITEAKKSVVIVKAKSPPNSQSAAVTTSPIWSSETSPTSSFGHPAFVTVPYQYTKCHEVVTSFAYDEDLCAGASDPEKYLDLGSPRYTCLNRCGHTPTYGARFYECGCDVNCKTHGDCCRDMPDLCPELHNTDNLVGPDISIRFTSCGTFLCIMKPYVEGPVFSFSTKPYPRYTPAIVHRKNAVPFKPRSLVKYAKSLYIYKVLDIKRKVIFHNFATYKFYEAATSIPLFIPTVLDLKCSPDDLSTEAHSFPSALQLLPWCLVTKVEGALTHYHRPSVTFQMLNCRCEDGSYVKEHVHNACLGLNSSQHVRYRHPLQELQLKYARDVPLPNKNCMLQDITYTGIMRKTGVLDRKTPLKMRLSPVLSQPKKLQQAANNKVDEWFSEANGRNVRVIVELSNTAERRFVCPSIRSTLQSCKIEMCADGGLLWIDGLSGLRSCIFPTRIRVDTIDKPATLMPLCTCLVIMTTVSNLGLWEVKKLTLDRSTECLLSLKAIPKKHDPLDATLELRESSSSPTGSSWSTEWSSDQPDTDQLSRRLAGIAQSCPEDGDHTFQICFLSGREGNSASACLTLGSESHSGSHAKHTGGLFLVMSFSIFKNLVIYFISD